MPMANFSTEGRTMTQSALSRRSCGMSSGMLRISVMTLPAFSTRSTSFLSLAGVVETMRRVTNMDAKKFFIGSSLEIPGPGSAGPQFRMGGESISQFEAGEEVGEVEE